MPGRNVTISILGPLEVNGPEGRVELSSRKLAGLIGYLACAPTMSVPRETLMTLLWGSHFDEQARQNLRQAIARLRRLLGTDVIRTDRDFVALDASTVSCDATEFTRLLATSNPADRAAAVALYRGGLLCDVVIKEEAWLEWVEVERKRVDELATDTMITVGRETLAAGRQQGALGLVQRALAINDLREDAHRLMMEVLAASGRTADALAYYDALAQRLQRELGARPDETTSAVAARLRMRKPLAALRPAVEAPSSREATSSMTPANDQTSNRTGTQVGSVELAILPRQATPQQALQLSDLIARNSLHVVEVGGEGQRMWHARAASPADAAQLAFDLQAACRGWAASGGGPTVSIGAHALPPGDLTAPHLHLDLARLAAPGQMLASQELREVVTDGLEATVHDVGFMSRSGAAPPVRTFRLEPPIIVEASRASGIWRQRPSIAVLPFEGVGFDPESATFSELLADEITGVLSHSAHLDVISQLSTRVLSAQRYSLERIWNHLQADYLIASKPRAIRGSGERLFELIDARTGVIRWSGMRRLAGTTPDEACEVADWIGAEAIAAILKGECEKAAAPLQSLESYTLLFGAITLMDRWTLPSFNRSRELLAELYARAPTHPLTNAWLAAWHIRSISQGWTRDPLADGEAAIAFAARSLDADPNCSIALAMDGWAHVYARKRLDIAADRLAEAIQVNPNDSLAWLLKGVTDAFRAEGASAGQAGERAIRLSPLDPRRSYYDSMAATAALGDGDWERAITLAKRSLRTNRLHPSTLRALATAQWNAGALDDARMTVEDIMQLDPTFTVSEYERRHPAVGTAFGTLVTGSLLAAGAPR